MHIEKMLYTRAQGLIQHVLRFEGDGIDHTSFHVDWGRIDETKTKDNVAFVKTEDGVVVVTPTRELQAEVRHTIRDAVKHHEEVCGKSLRKDSPFASIVCTLPKDVDRGREKEFFRLLYDYVDTECPGQVVMAGCHFDETTPHIHIATLPLTEDGKLLYNEVFNRDFYRSFHLNAQTYMESHGMYCSLLLGEDDVVSRALSFVPQRYLTRARAAMWRPVRRAQGKLERDKAQFELDVAAFEAEKQAWYETHGISA